MCSDQEEVYLMPSLDNIDNMKKEEIPATAQPSLNAETLDGLGQLKQSVQNKIRNLEKRKTKLDSIKAMLSSGKHLTSEQQEAYSKYGEVVQAIEVQTDFLKLVITTQNDYAKQQKQRKKEERDRTTNQLKDLLKYQDILNMLGNDEIRPDFLNGVKGAVKLAVGDLRFYDDQFKKLCPTREDSADWGKSLDESAQNAYHLIMGTSKPVPVFDDITYHQFKERLEEISNCTYFDNRNEQLVDEDTAASKGSVESNKRPSTPVDDESQPQVTHNSQQFVANAFDSSSVAAEPLVNGGTSRFPAVDDQSLYPAVTGNSFMADDTLVSTLPYNQSYSNMAPATHQNHDGHVEQVQFKKNEHFSASSQAETQSAAEKVDGGEDKFGSFHEHQSEHSGRADYSSSQMRQDEEFVTQNRRSGGYRGNQYRDGGENGDYRRGRGGGGYHRGSDEYRGSGNRRGGRGFGGGFNGEHRGGYREPRGGGFHEQREGGYRESRGGGNGEFHGGSRGFGRGRGGGEYRGRGFGSSFRGGREEQASQS